MTVIVRLSCVQVFINFVSQQQELMQEVETADICQPGPPTEMQPIATATQDPDNNSDDVIIDLGLSCADSGCQGDGDAACILESEPESLAASSLGIVADMSREEEEGEEEEDPLLGKVNLRMNVSASGSSPQKVPHYNMTILDLLCGTR